MNKDRVEHSGHDYVPPTQEELDFEELFESGKRLPDLIEEQKQQLNGLIEKQRHGIEEFGIRPQYPRGLHSKLKPRWRRKV